jgi:hypothetical protein
VKFENAHTARIAFAVLLAVVLLAPAYAQNGFGGNGPGQGTGATVQPATEAEAQSLAFMREEEKLARDVYQQLYEKWNLTTFRNISASEEQHFKAVGTLLTRYGVADPAADTQPGIFVDKTLTELYSQLMAKGTLSLKDALEVGVLIEQTDINDLKTSLGATAKFDIVRVYTNLLSASFQHLDAFETALETCAIAAPAN